MDRNETLENLVDTAGEWLRSALAALPSFLAAVVVFVLFWFAAKLVRRLVTKVLGRVSHHKAVNQLVSTMAYVAVIALGLLVALGILNLNKTVTSLLAGAGILGLAVGFAAQDSVENLISGVLLSLRQPFRVGQIIESNDAFGTVEEINLRATVIRRPQGPIVHVPNSDILGNPLVNYSELGQRRVDIACGVSYADDLEKAKRVAIEAIEGIEGLEEGRDVELFYDEFGGSSINFKLRYWLPFGTGQGDFLAKQSEGIIRLKAAFDANDISIPFPIRTLDFGIDGGASLSEQLKGLSAGRSNKNGDASTGGGGDAGSGGSGGDEVPT